MIKHGHPRRKTTDRTEVLRENGFLKMGFCTRQQLFGEIAEVLKYV